MEFSLRPATQADQSAIRSLIRRVKINPMGVHWQHFILAVDGSGRMVGCGQINHHNDDSYELASIAVEPCCRGQGIARAIIERLLQGAPNPLYLTCRTSLAPLYEKFGFTTTARDAMPPYFRRIVRLTSILGKVVRLEGPLVMVRRQ